MCDGMVSANVGECAPKRMCAQLLKAKKNPTKFMANKLETT